MSMVNGASSGHGGAAWGEKNVNETPDTTTFILNIAQIQLYEQTPFTHV